MTTPAPSATPNSMPGAASAAAPTTSAANGAAQPATPAPATATSAATPTAAASAPDGAAPPAAAATPPAADNTPPWEKSGEPFNPERAWNLIQNVRNELAEYRERTEPIVAEREQLRRASQTELERAQEDVGAVTSDRNFWRDRAVLAEARTHAERFIDADAALALIGDISDFAGGDEIDVAKITARFDQLAVDKPHLVKAAPQPPGFTPNRGQGQSGTGAVPLDAQIKAAQESGNVMQSIALKQQQFYQKQR